MVNDYYDMMHQTREKVKQHAEENGYPAPSSTFTPIFASLVTRHKLSIIIGEIDKMIDRLFVLNDALDNAIEENNLVAVVLIKTRLDEEKAKLRSYERLLDMEAGVIKENQDMEQAKERAREYPMEQLLSEYGCQVKFRRTRCPIHEGKNQSSFEVKDNKGRCHSCGWYGDTIELVRKMEGCSFQEAVRRLQ